MNVYLAMGLYAILSPSVLWSGFCPLFLSIPVYTDILTLLNPTGRQISRLVGGFKLAIHAQVQGTPNCNVMHNTYIIVSLKACPREPACFKIELKTAMV